jgi:hypothetical protein
MYGSDSARTPVRLGPCTARTPVSGKTSHAHVPRADSECFEVRHSEHTGIFGDVDSEFVGPLPTGGPVRVSLRPTCPPSARARCSSESPATRSHPSGGGTPPLNSSPATEPARAGSVSQARRPGSVPSASPACRVKIAALAALAGRPAPAQPQQRASGSCSNGLAWRISSHGLMRAVRR